MSEAKLVISSITASLLAYFKVKHIVAPKVFSLFSNALAIPKSVSLAD